MMLPLVFMTAKPQYSIWYVLKGLFCTALFYGASYYIPNFTAAKMYLKNLHGEHFSHTFYGDIPFDAQGITLLCPEGWSEEDCRLEWDHIVPASFLAKNLPCWSQDSCPFHENWSHRRCCQETSMEFTFREANVANIMPALRKLNREKSNFLPGIVKNHRRVKVLCGVKIDPKNKIFEPCDHRKGWTARIYLEMDALYHLPFTAQQKQMLQNWDQKFPMEADEKRHNELLKQSA